MTVEYVAAHFSVRHSNGPVTVVQVGAFDGIANDPIRDAIERFQWRAILLEPQRVPFEALRHLHAHNPQVTVVNAAIARTDGTRALFSIEAASGVPAWTQQIASFDRKHLDRQSSQVPGVDMRALIRETTVQTLTFESLFEQAGVEHVHVLQVDTEGYDLEILRMFDVPHRLPAIVNYEHEHLTTEGRNEAMTMLLDSGYAVAMSSGGFDTVAYRTQQ